MGNGRCTAIVSTGTYPTLKSPTREKMGVAITAVTPMPTNHSLQRTRARVAPIGAASVPMRGPPAQSAACHADGADIPFGVHVCLRSRGSFAAPAVTPTTRKIHRTVFRQGERLASGTLLYRRKAAVRIVLGAGEHRARTPPPLECGVPQQGSTRRRDPGRRLSPDPGAGGHDRGLGPAALVSRERDRASCDRRSVGRSITSLSRSQHTSNL
jgi:hypothetical protein